MRNAQSSSPFFYKGIRLITQRTYIIEVHPQEVTATFWGTTPPKRLSRDLNLSIAHK